MKKRVWKGKRLFSLLLAFVMLAGRLEPRPILQRTPTSAW